MKKEKQNGFEAGPPVDDGSGFPESEFQDPKKHYVLIAGTAEVDVDMEKDPEYDISLCPYCGAKSLVNDWAASVDGLETTFTCKKGDQWVFIADKINGEIQPKKGLIRGLSKAPNGTTKEPDVES